MNDSLSFDRLPIVVSQMMEKLNRIETLLIKPAEPPKPQRFDLNGALDYLKQSGYVFSKSQMQKLTASGDIPCKKFNSRLVFEQSSLDAWVQSKTVTVGNKSDEASLTLARSCRGFEHHTH